MIKKVSDAIESLPWDKLEVTRGDVPDYKNFEQKKTSEVPAKASS